MLILWLLIGLAVALVTLAVLNPPQTRTTSKVEKPSGGILKKIFGVFAENTTSKFTPLESKASPPNTRFPSQTTYTHKELTSLKKTVYDLSPRDPRFYETLKQYLYALEDRVEFLEKERKDYFEIRMNKEFQMIEFHRDN